MKVIVIDITSTAPAAARGYLRRHAIGRHSRKPMTSCTHGDRSPDAVNTNTSRVNRIAANIESATVGLPRSHRLNLLMCSA